MNNKSKWLVLLFLTVQMAACTVTPTQTLVPVTPTSVPATQTMTPVLSETPTVPSATVTLVPSPLPTMASVSATPVSSRTPTLATNSLPRPDHVVVIIFENKSFSQIIGNSCCQYINQQAQSSAVMTQSFALTHPSQPNYLELFSGSAQGVGDDSCPPPGSPYPTTNLGQQLIEAGLTFAGFSEDLPSIGSTVCNTSTYARKHNPWVDFGIVPSSVNLPFSSFPSDFTKLPTVSFVIPNLCNDMHDCAPKVGDVWLANHLDGYIQWAKTHNSLFILTFDEDDGSSSNQIATFFEGAMVKVGSYDERVNHYNVLRTLEEMYRLPYAGQAAKVTPITDIWKMPTP